MAKKSSLNTVHPLVLFWAGVLTGAIVVGLIFLYKTLTPDDYQTYVLRGYTQPIAQPPVTEVELYNTDLTSWGIGGGGSIPTNDVVEWGIGGGGSTVR